MIGRRATAAGFTLLEVLVALAIVALALAVLLPTLSESLVTGRSAAAELAATVEAETLLARVGADIPLVDSVLSGEDGGLAWTIEIGPWAAGDPARLSGGLAAHRVVVSVTWPGRLRPRTLRLDTLRLAVRQ
jgi:general secretion pathway protein I